MEKNLTSMDIEKILSEYEDALFLRFEKDDNEMEALPESATPPSVEKILAGVLRHKVAVLRNKDYYQAKLMQMFKLVTLLLDDMYTLEADRRKACIDYLLNELYEDLTDVMHIIDTLPDLRSRKSPS